MPGRCVPGRGIVIGVVCFASSAVAGVARAQPSAGFPDEPEPVPPPSAAPALPAREPAPAPSPPGADPAAPLVDPYPPGGVMAPATAAPADPGVSAGRPLVLPHHAGHPVPPGYHVETRPATGLIVTGALTLGIGYAAALGVGLDEGFENGWVALPVLGPWAAIGAREFDCGAETVEEARRCFDGAYREATTIAVLAVDGMIQATGLVILFAGLLSSRDELVRDDASSLAFSAARRPEGGFDLGLRGRF